MRRVEVMDGMDNVPLILVSSGSRRSSAVDGNSLHGEDVVEGNVEGGFRQFSGTTAGRIPKRPFLFMGLVESSDSAQLCVILPILPFMVSVKVLVVSCSDLRSSHVFFSFSVCFNNVCLGGRTLWST